MLSSMFENIMQRIDDATDPELAERVEQLSRETNEYGYDEFGFSREWLRRVTTLSSWLYKNYFRMETHGIEHIPEGRCFVAGNHSSQMAYDGLMIITALLLEANPPKHATGMAGHFFFGNPGYSQLLPRIGQINGTPANCRRALEKGQAIMVFPEGEVGGGKTIFNKYALMPFKQGFMRLALETDSPIVPFAFIGGEEMVPSFSRLESLAAKVGMPYFTLSPTGPLPLPTKCSLYFGEPMHFTGDPQDKELVTKHVADVKEQVQALTERGLAERESVF